MSPLALSSRVAALSLRINLLISLRQQLKPREGLRLSRPGGQRHPLGFLSISLIPGLQVFRTRPSCAGDRTPVTLDVSGVYC